MVKRLLIILFVWLLLATTHAQTLWEYATFEISSKNFSDIYTFKDRERRGDASSIPLLGTQIGIHLRPDSNYFDVLEALGKEGYEMVSHEKSRMMYEENLFELETWYFKRPL